jgi:hypothetical protein
MVRAAGFAPQRLGGEFLSLLPAPVRPVLARGPARGATMPLAAIRAVATDPTGEHA